MRENSDDFDLHSCLRNARRWAIALLCMLAINGSLVALAFGGFGAAARHEPIPHGTAANVPPVVPTASAATPAQTPTPAVPPPTEPDVAPLSVAIADPPPAAPVIDVPPNDPPPVTSPQPRPALFDPPPAVSPAANVPPYNAVPLPAADSLIVANPPDIGGAVNFTFNGVVHALAPGEYVELAGRKQRLVEFHRGDDFGYAAHQLEAGLHAFELCATGWTLKPLEAAAARKLLGACREKAASP